MGEDRYLEDIVVGEVSVGAPIAITEAAIIAFATDYDPQAMHIDPAAARDGRFGGVIASGWHVAALVMRDFVDSAPFGKTPLLGMRTDALCWLLPVRPGDTLTARREVLSATRSRTRPDQGRILLATKVANQTGAIVMTLETLIQIPARNG